MGIMLLILLTVSVLLAAALREKAEAVFPWVLLTVIGILYPFYCLNLLRLGRYAVYGCLLLAALISVRAVHRQRISVSRYITPGICLFAGLCVVFMLYTHDRLVGLWDELRLWGAVPKALYHTESLQLGKDAMIFSNMQPYPPGMPLLVYFLTALDPAFREGHIFAAYAVFFAAMILPGLGKFRWKQWPLLLPLALAVICAPCLFTSHGGDGSWFYGSLFIDPILGALAGYAFFLSCDRPFETVFSGCRFLISLLVLSLIKDSGAMFALLAGLNGGILSLRGRKCEIRKCLLRLILVLAPSCTGYGLWRAVLAAYGVSSGSLGALPTTEAFAAFWEQLNTLDMVFLRGPILGREFRMTYIPCFLALTAAAVLLQRRRKAPGFWLTWSAMALSIVLFSLGYIMSFGASLPSFQRYMSTTLILLLVFVLLRGIPALLDWLSEVKLPGIIKIPAALLSVAVLCSAVLFVGRWRGNQTAYQTILAPAREAAATLTAAEGPGEVYLLIAGDARENAKLHHRIYFELLGTPVRVLNFWSHVNILGEESTPEAWDPEKHPEAVRSWADQLARKGYEYVYVVSVDAFLSRALAELGVEDAQPGMLCRLQQTDGEVRLITD